MSNPMSTGVSRVICTNPERIPEARRTWHAMTCACLGALDVCRKAWAPAGGSAVADEDSSDDCPAALESSPAPLTVLSGAGRLGSYPGSPSTSRSGK